MRVHGRNMNTFASMNIHLLSNMRILNIIFLDILIPPHHKDDDNPILMDNPEFQKLPSDLQRQLLKKGFLESNESGAVIEEMNVPVENSKKVMIK